MILKWAPELKHFWYKFPHLPWMTKKKIDTVLQNCLSSSTINWQTFRVNKIIARKSRSPLNMNRNLIKKSQEMEIWRKRKSKVSLSVCRKRKAPLKTWKCKKIILLNKNLIVTIHWRNPIQKNHKWPRRPQTNHRNNKFKSNKVAIKTLNRISPMIKTLTNRFQIMISQLANPPLSHLREKYKKTMNHQIGSKITKILSSVAIQINSKTNGTKTKKHKDIPAEFFVILSPVLLF